MERGPHKLHCSNGLTGYFIDSEALLINERRVYAVNNYGFKVLLSIMLVIALFPSISESSDKDGVINYYRACIMKEIDGCNAKVELYQPSKSGNLRNYGKLKEQKLIFLTKQKDLLIERMIEAQIAPKQHKVEVFLNSTFFKELRR
jgi:hypothetical protein